LSQTSPNIAPHFFVYGYCVVVLKTPNISQLWHRILTSNPYFRTLCLKELETYLLRQASRISNFSYAKPTVKHASSHRVSILDTESGILVVPIPTNTAYSTNMQKSLEIRKIRIRIWPHSTNSLDAPLASRLNHFSSGPGGDEHSHYVHTNVEINWAHLDIFIQSTLLQPTLLLHRKEVILIGQKEGRSS